MKKMTLRQRFLKWIYPLFMRVSKSKEAVLENKNKQLPLASIYDLTVVLSTGKEIDLAQFRGKKLLLVNTASDCGYTAQYGELQKLYEHSKEELEIIAFPSNDFKEQEKADDAAIREFCTINFNVRFPLAKKSVVRKTEGQHPVFSWLSSSEKNGWINKSPSWNFAKYLVNEDGMLTHYFEPTVSPLSQEFIAAVNS